MTISRYLMILSVVGSFLAPATAQGTKAREVVAAGIQAMGGETYLKVRNSHSTGSYFMFDREGRKGFSKYIDWTVLQPIKWRFQLGEGKRQTVEVYNLELGKAWRLEGKSSLEELPQEDIDNFRRSARHDIDILFRTRLSEPGMNLYYYGPDDIAGTGEFEAVEFLDEKNDSVIVFFNRQNHLPAKVETKFTDKLGIAHKEEVEFFNWHTIQGVHTPLRVDVSVDGRISQQRFIDELSFDISIPDSYFLEPKIEAKK